MAKELRITFKESESSLYEYIKAKSSPSAFLKDLAAIEKKREDIYLNNNFSIIQEPIIDQPSNTQEISVDDLDISDLEG